MHLGETNLHPLETGDKKNKTMEGTRITSLESIST